MHSIYIPSITCGHCAKSVAEVLNGVGVRSQIDIATQTVILNENNPGKIAGAIEALKKSGFPPVTKRALIPLRAKAILSWVLTSPFFIGMIWHDLMPANTTQFVLSSFVLSIGLSHFLPATISGFKRGTFTMDALISIGVLSAYGLSVYILFLHSTPHELYFESAASIITFVLTGALLESSALKKASEKLKPALDLIPNQLQIISGTPPFQSIDNVAPSDAKIGDRFMLQAGERLPLDSVVEKDIEVDLSALTGESQPMLYTTGSLVPAGAILRGTPAIFQAQKIFSDSTYAQIELEIEKARAHKPDLQRVGDKIANYFVPAVLLISFCTFILWLLLDLPIDQAIIRAVTVLIVACPCAIGLAIPTAISVALGRAAGFGTIIKKAQVFELLPKIKQVIWDKTGTLTSPSDFEVEITHLNSATNQEELEICAALAKSSHHPYSIAIAKKLLSKTTHPILSNIIETPGHGIEATLGDKKYFLGKVTQKDLNYDINFCVNSSPLLAFKIKDSLRDGAQEVINYFKSKDITQGIISGDSNEKCQIISEKLGIPSQASLSPTDKERIVKEKQTASPTLYIGDGINDGPALSLATVSAAFAAGSALAQQNADIVLLSDSLSSIKRLSIFSGQVLAIMHQNLFWAFIYNILMIPLAIFGILSPTVAAFSMAASDIIVIGNSLRLRWLR